MRTTKVGVIVGTLSLAAALIALLVRFPGVTLPSVHAQVQAQDADREGCSLETLRGAYGLTFHGFAAANNAFIPVVGGGLVMFDGDGNHSISETVSLGGQIVPLKLPGTYRVNSDCTGYLTAGSGMSAVHLNLVIVRNGREILAVNADPGGIAVDDFIKQ